MEIYLSNILLSIEKLPNFYFYLVLFFSSILENIFPPFAGDTVILFAAFLASKGKLSFLGVYVISSAGSSIGFFLLYLTARRFGRAYFLKKDFRFFSAKNILLAEKKFEKTKDLILLLNRFFPGIRSVIAIVSGIVNVKPYKIFIFSFLSACAWNILWISGGYLLESNWDNALNKVKEISMFYNKISIIIMIAIAFISYIIYRLFFRNKKSS